MDVSDDSSEKTLTTTNMMTAIDIMDSNPSIKIFNALLPSVGRSPEGVTVPTILRADWNDPVGCPHSSQNLNWCIAGNLLPQF